ncbi:hypothetical protein OG413_31920 [Streptomyces sp. NBC_01433]|uniref:hypothetical protein n=1 Tax=Streptomyces sp. NBC_01433 TaxID=2903864 RepID=UPI0022541EFC|nr:hypothetical protein [Streptomyces sp. NBC_01433]MCX4679835.1 hypothetical protein [Streptomyces sp. NBC_01433]
MSSMSRRSLLGYSGSAAAGAAFASAGTATAAGAEESRSTTVEFDPGTEFAAQANAADSDLMMEMTFSVRVDRPNGVPSAQEITPLEIAEALSALAEAKGWPPITFYGTPPRVPLN